jgi:type IV secretory pathway VirB2 component (pilin)
MPAGCFLVLWSVVCCGGLVGAVAVVFVVLCCLAWAVGVFDVPLWVPPLVGTVGYI